MATLSANTSQEPLYGGYSRFELELEFVQSLANPAYINFLAQQKLLDDPDLVRYLDYLQYWREPKYAKYLLYPGPTVKALELLKQPRFREEIRGGQLAIDMMQADVDAVWQARPY